MSRDSEAPIGVFDSGLGGLTVVRALRDRLPNEDVIYLGDTARVPYGTRSPDTILRYARGCARVLTDRGVKGLIIACNTASAVAVEMLRAELDLPVVGVVEPGAAAAVRVAEALGDAGDPRGGRIGVLGTASTIGSGAYPRAVSALSTRVEVLGHKAPLLVPLVEEGWTEGDLPRLAVTRYVEPLVEADVGVVVLGCTHYPLLAPLITRVLRDLAGREVAVVDSADATGVAVRTLLEERALGSKRSGRGRLELLVTDMPGSFAEMARRFLGSDIPPAEPIDL